MDIHYIIKYLHRNLEIPFEEINERKQAGGSWHFHKGREYDIKFTSEAELRVNGSLIEDWSKYLIY